MILEQMTQAMIEPLVQCRKLFGGPFNPKFDVCKLLEDCLMEVLLQIFIFLQHYPISYILSCKGICENRKM